LLAFCWDSLNVVLELPAGADLTQTLEGQLVKMTHDPLPADVVMRRLTPPPGQAGGGVCYEVRFEGWSAQTWCGSYILLRFSYIPAGWLLYLAHALTLHSALQLLGCI